jgi:dTDP-glucose 4,6-dehydratase
MMSRILLTGGKGFIGRNLLDELSNRGHLVHTCDTVHGEEENHLRCDVASYGQLALIFERFQFDYVYHLAAECGRRSGEDHYEDLWRTNVIGTKNIIRLQEKYRFKMVFLSSAGVYGDYDGLMSEDVTQKIPLRHMNDYAMTKWVGEMQVLNSAAMYETETVRVRPVNAYGPHEYYSPARGAIPVFAYSALMRRPYTVYTGHLRIFDYVEDTCRTLANIVDNFIPGEVYNIGGRWDWVTDIKRVSDIVLGYLGIDDSLVTYRKAEPFATVTKRLNCSKAVRDLKHDPIVPIEKGIPCYIEWMKKAYLNRQDARAPQLISKAIAANSSAFVEIASRMAKGAERIFRLPER